jgi:hypothetical protein
MVVDLKTLARRYTDLEVEASLQLSVVVRASGDNTWRISGVSGSASGLTRCPLRTGEGAVPGLGWRPNSRERLLCRLWAPLASCPRGDAGREFLAHTL